jgi:hypothetical protein
MHPFREEKAYFGLVSAFRELEEKNESEKHP